MILSEVVICNAMQRVRAIVLLSGVVAIAVYAEDVHSPHWTRDGCTACHDPDRGKPAAIDPANVTSICITCHDGRTAVAESHPVGRSVNRPHIRLPQDWPAPDGRLSCLTCHDVVLACDPQSTAQESNSMMLRSGPVLDQTAYCAGCHVAEAHARLNPHRTLTDQKKPDPSTCNYCHTEAPGAQSPHRRTGNPRLRGNESVLCLGCHGRHVDYFEPGHFGATVQGDMAKRLANSSGRLPLSPSGTLTCSTCHNPHQQGTFADDSILEFGGQQFGRSTDQSMPLRGYGPRICGACHGP